MLGALLAFISAATFGFNNASVRRGVLTGTVGQAIAITVPLGLPLFVIPALATGQLAGIGALGWLQWLYLGMAGVLHFVWGRYCNYRAVQAMGSNLAGTVMQAQLLIALVLAMTFLGETLTVMKILGIAMIVAGPGIIVYGRTGKANRAALTEGPAKFKPRFFEGSAFALLAATGYGASPILVRAGLTDIEGITAGILGGFVSYAASTAVVVLFLLVRPSQFRHAVAVDPRAARWFIVSGVAVWLSQFFRYLALGVAAVTVVQPIGQLSVIFRLIFAWFMNREYEVFDARAVLAVIVSFAGAVLLATSTEILNGWIALPDALRPVLAWQWP
jgi:uncharacterized membrane protein